MTGGPHEALPGEGTITVLKRYGVVHSSPPPETP